MVQVKEEPGAPSSPNKAVLVPLVCQGARGEAALTVCLDKAWNGGASSPKEQREDPLAGVLPATSCAQHSG